MRRRRGTLAVWLAGLVTLLFVTGAVPLLVSAHPAASAPLVAGPPGPGFGTASALPAVSASQGGSPRAPSAVAGGSASGTWVNLSLAIASEPPSRGYDRSMAYDPVDGYVVLFGGYTGSYLDDTWTFANGTWTQLHPTTSPSGRDHSTLVWDAADGYLLLFGGSGYAGAYNDTWSFLGGQWTHIPTPVAPSQRWAASMTYDASDGYALLFGGCVSGVAAGDTWTYLNGTWTQLHPTPAPDDRQDGQMAYDAQLGTVVLFSGGGYYGASYADTWTFHNGSWTNVTSSPQPPARQMGGMAYDSTLGAVLLFGGENTQTFTVLADTWAYDASGWTQLSPASSPSFETFPALADDPADHTLVHYGVTTAGFPVTWVWDSVALLGTASVARGEIPLRVLFDVTTDAGSPPINFTWSFGDATVGYGPTPSHVYQDPGLFIARVLVTDKFGSSATLQFVEEALIPLRLVASGTPVNGTPPLLVGFNASAIGGYPPYLYFWSFGDGATDTVPAPSHLYARAGHYDATVEVSDQRNQSWNGSVPVVVQSPLSPISALVVPSASSGTAPLVDRFTAAVSGGFPPYSYSWSVVPGGTAYVSTSSTPSFTFPAPASYLVSVAVADRYGNSASASTTVNVTAVLTSDAAETGQSPGGGNAPLNASFAATADGGTPPYVFTWAFGDGGTGSGASLSHVFVSAGTYDVTARTYDHAGASVVSLIHLTVLAPLPGPVTKNGTHSTAPANASTSASWVGGLGVGLIAGAAAGGALAMVLLRRPPARRMGRR